MYELRLYSDRIQLAAWGYFLDCESGQTRFAQVWTLKFEEFTNYENRNVKIRDFEARRFQNLKILGI